MNIDMTTPSYKNYQFQFLSLFMVFLFSKIETVEFRL